MRGRVAGGVRASAALALGGEVKGGSAKTSGHVFQERTGLVGLRITHHPKSAEYFSEVARPKSAMHTRSPLRLTRMFSGFRSR